jgi:hypothetical protein
MGQFHNLDNEDVIFVYLSNERFLEEYELLFEAKSVDKISSVNNDTVMFSSITFSDEEIEEIKNRDHYKYCMSVRNKLGPIVEIIKETLPDIYDKVYKTMTQSNEDVL